MKKTFQILSYSLVAILLCTSISQAQNDDPQLSTTKATYESKRGIIDGVKRIRIEIKKDPFLETSILRSFFKDSNRVIYQELKSAFETSGYLVENNIDLPTVVAEMGKYEVEGDTLIEWDNLEMSLVHKDYGQLAKIEIKRLIPIEDASPGDENILERGIVRKIIAGKQFIVKDLRTEIKKNLPMSKWKIN
jgi:hypothetical protein